VNFTFLQYRVFTAVEQINSKTFFSKFILAIVIFIAACPGNKELFVHATHHHRGMPLSGSKRALGMLRYIIEQL